MIRQPDKESRNINEPFYNSESRRIAMFNQVLGDIAISKEEEKTLIWLAGWEDSTVINIISIIEKVGKRNLQRL